MPDPRLVQRTTTTSRLRLPRRPTSPRRLPSPTTATIGRCRGRRTTVHGSQHRVQTIRRHRRHGGQTRQAGPRLSAYRSARPRRHRPLRSTPGPHSNSPKPTHDSPKPTKPSRRPRTEPDRPAKPAQRRGPTWPRRRDYDSHNQIEHWSYLPERLEAAEQRIDALDGWRDWAEGKAITDGTVIDVVHSLSAEARTNDSPAHAALANVIHQWAQTKDLDLSRPTPTIERAGIEIDL